VTGEKPESKLWWAGGYWWGSLYYPPAGEYHIYRLNPASHDWVDIGVALDDRPHSRADVLWDGTANKLYVASHYRQENPSPTTNPLDWGRLYRYTFNAAGLTYTLDEGFPITINTDRTETLVLDKDSFGRLWVTYVSRQAGGSEYHVYVNASQGSDQSWGTPLILPAAAVNMDDISSLIAFDDDDGPQIGVMWSNQQDDKFYFATHPDSAAPQNGWMVEPVTAVGYPADDHINLAATNSGQVLAAVKLETTNSSDPLTGVIGRDSDGSFSFHPITFVSSLETRPVIVIDESSNMAYVMATNKSTGGIICYWPAAITTPLANLDFPQLPCLSSGGGAPVLIGDSTYDQINDATSAKQNLNSASGIVVLASDDFNEQVYVHNQLFQITPTPSSTSTTPLPTPSSTSTTPTVTATPSLTPSLTPTPSATPENGGLFQRYLPFMFK
jgi:hypothetical protein